MFFRKSIFSIVLTSAVFVLLLGVNGCQTTARSNGGDDNILSYVPADSIYFAGGAQAWSVNEMFTMFGHTSGFIELALQDSAKNSDKPITTPGDKMVQQLLAAYFDATNQPQNFSNTSGIGDKFSFAIYSVGIIPVLRIQLQNTVKFESYIQNIETQAQITPVIENQAQLTIRKYSFRDDKTSTNTRNSSLVIAVQNNYALLTLNFDETSDELKHANQQILGIIKPGKALNIDRLTALVDKYHFDPRFIFYIDHKEIIRGFTSNQNQFGEMVKMFEELSASNKLVSATEDLVGEAPAPEQKQAPAPQTDAKKNDFFAQLQTPACQSELAAKAENWPQTVAGYTILDLQNKPAVTEYKTVVEINDKNFVKSLSSLRGVVPEYVATKEQAMIFGFGLGINIDAIAPFVMDFIKEFSAHDYQCKFLADLKQKMQESNPSMLIAMATGMAAGVFGASATLLNFEGNFDGGKQKMPEISDFQAIVTVSAKNPQILLMSLRQINPNFPPIQLPEDGTPVELPLPLPIPDRIKLAQKGKHIVAYIGKDSIKLAQDLQNLPLQGNGFLASNIDFLKFIKFGKSLPGANPDAPDSDQKLQEALEFFGKFKYRFIENIEFSDYGIEVSDTTIY